MIFDEQHPDLSGSQLVIAGWAHWESSSSAIFTLHRNDPGAIHSLNGYPARWPVEAGEGVGNNSEASRNRSRLSRSCG
jgi:hypothetical protein